MQAVRTSDAQLLPMMPAPVLSVRLSRGRACPIYFEPLALVPALMEAEGLSRGQCIVVTDEHVGVYYLAPLVKALEAGRWKPIVITLSAGEHSKGPGPLQDIYDAALDARIDRATPLLALGGGVVGDVAGYAAATLLRGLPLVQLPTSLIAQVDSAIGGKTGINHRVGKNLVGAFHQPRLVCADPSCLNTLPELEWTSGLAEVVKHALIADVSLLVDLEDAWTRVMARDVSFMQAIVRRAAAVKVAVVSEDERETSRRMILNFGHTFAHAIERVAGYGKFTHGEAVAVGMRAALKVSHLLHLDLPLKRLDGLVRKLPVRHSLLGLPVTTLMEAMRHDKKMDGAVQRLVLLKRPGEAYVTRQASPDQIQAGWAFARGA